jgi:hypothetical protein
VAERDQPIAVFEDRQVMEKAVHALVEEGIVPQRIRVSQAEARRGDVPREHGTILLTGLALGAGTGAVLALVWLYWLAEVTFVPLIYAVFRTLGGAAAGALLGGLLALLVDAVHRGPSEAIAASPGEFIVTVKVPPGRDPSDVRTSLAVHGGHVLLA